MTELNPGFAAEARSTVGEISFQVHEMFFSRTDKRGVIKAGNGVFRRISGYSWDELAGTPHKIIRHADMPRGVFQFMWDTIKADKPVGTYVKNRDKSGGYYWVFALVAPWNDGYISIRLKPTSPMRETVAAIYADLLKAEREDGLTPQQSAELLLERVRELGYASYQTFQAAAIAAEFEARAKAMGEPLEQVQKRLLTMSRGIADVQVETAEMTEAFNAIRTVPMNMRIIASRLENAGGPISAISVNYSQMLEEMSTWVNTFVDGDTCVFARIRDAILNSQFLGFAAALQQEVSETLTRADVDSMPGHDLDRERATIVDLRADFLKQTRDSLGSVETEAMRFGRSVLDMKRYVTGLSSTRMMCKIESATLSDQGTALGGIVEQLDACQNEIEKRLARIVELNAVIQSNTAMLRALV
ncbi:PAS domain-containing protein [Citreimonas salinaria]|uniref:Aerotaxis receptor n=1 Tax=Citreimonas salinaria TaxID=321339 RepID=A0A1H3JGN3_9RHOB|nr:PAS domain-containing protein [Citreimonas salinaria]SDY39150.1 aerotaxis receptor [Citreimonas salinaria]